MQVVRYVHIRLVSPRDGKWVYQPRGGATVRVSGNTDTPGQVDLQVAFCSKKDTFCKERGRIEAFKAPVKIVPLRYIGKHVQDIAQEAMNRREGGTKGLDVVVENNYDFLIRYFLPKE